MGEVLNHLESWFAQRPLWLQDATRRVVQNGAIDENDLKELIRLCKQEAGIPDSELPKISPRGLRKGAFRVRESPITLRLEEISDVKGVNALSPRNPLNFGQSPLTIVYGATGSGKSGYVRILKHACGARKTGELHGNVFDKHDSGKSCVFKINVGSSCKKIKWSDQSGILDDIGATEIYDTDCAHVYLTEENEVAYEPWVLSLFTQLTTVCTQIGKTLKDEIDHWVSKLPALPAQYMGTTNAAWYSGLSHETKQQDIYNKCDWNQALKIKLDALNQRLSEPDPAKQAQKLRTTKTNLLALHDELKKIRDKLSEEKCSEYITASKDAKAKRKAADDDAKKVFENAPLDGVGSESWRLLWEQARAYSETKAYPGLAFPNVSEGARCVLCQQILEAVAGQRFRSFEDFVKGELQKQANKAEKDLKTLKDEIEKIITLENLKLRIDSAGITDEAKRDEIVKFYALLVERKDALLKVETISDITDLPDEDLLTQLKDGCEELEKRAIGYDEDAKGLNREKLEKEARELEAQQWLATQKQSIEQEIDRHKKIHALSEARKLTHTKALTDMKSDLANVFVSPAFIKRFKDELDVLGAGYVKVDLVKTRAKYGRVFHRVRLKNCVKDVCTTDILSEGEFRIVSLAAFLADVEGRGHDTPFIFDDPISSLDQDFEEATAQRLINLCASRQVIVFTHRLSLLSQLEELAESAGIEPHVVSLRRESWGIGEPGETLLNEKNPKGALNNILNDRLPRARKELMEIGRSKYEETVKGICTDIRILVERLIENDLLANVVQRFRRSVQTQRRIHKLANINIDDCQLLDRYMTKYSRYKHSQPLEAPVSIPEPHEIENDLKELIGWLAQFKER